MKTLEEAVVQLEHEPDRTVIAEVNGLVVELRCRAGQAVDHASGERIPDRPLSELRGFLKGLRTEGFREKKDRIDPHRLVGVGDQATRRPKTGRSLRDEYQWLNSPPDEYRGRWVALIGDKVIAVADTLSDLRESLPPHLERTPLAVQVAC